MRIDPSILKYLALISQIGLLMAIPIFMSIFMGYWLDNKFGTSPLFLIIFILVGVYAAFRNLFVTVLKKTEQGKKDKNK
jgi:F0F1-type ATP synthase assembly protein I